MKKCCERNLLNIVCKECHSRCGVDCVWFNGKMSSKDTICARFRIMRRLYENGFRIRESSFMPLVKEINANVHLACQPERLNEETYFAVLNFYPK